MLPLSAALVLSARDARARVDEVLYDLGEGAFAYAGSQHTGQPRGLLWNGLTMQVRTGSTRDDLDAVLNAAAARCARRAATLTSWGAPRLLPLLRAQTRDRGYVACLRLDAPALSPEEFSARLRAFSHELDVSELGSVEFVSATRRGASTCYVVVDTVGRQPLRRAFPATGDAPGRDFADLPRPAGSRRVLSVSPLAGTPSLNLYAAAGERGTTSLAEAYRRRLLASGCRVHDRPASGATHFIAVTGSGAELLVYSPGGRADALAIVSMSQGRP